MLFQHFFNTLGTAWTARGNIHGYRVALAGNSNHHYADSVRLSQPVG